jgi:hypothetical protein
LNAFITSRTAKPIRFRVQQGVEGLLNRPTNHLAEMIPDPRFINLDDLAHRNPSSSLIASILPQFRGSGNPESAKDSIRYPKG